MTEDVFDRELGELESAEDFLEYFGVEYEPSVVCVNRLHILQRFRDYLFQVDEMPMDPAERRALYTDLLAGAYQDFTKSDARTEKVFRVFQLHGPRTATVDLSSLTGECPHETGA